MEETKPKTEQLQIKFRISEIRVLLFELSQRFAELKMPLSKESYEFRIDMKTGSKEQEKIFSVLLFITLFEKRNDTIKIELAKLNTLTSFEIQNFNEVFKKENNVLKIPNQILTMTSGIAISTARGIFSMSVKDTLLSNAIIPIVDPNLFLPNQSKK